MKRSFQFVRIFAVDHGSRPRRARTRLYQFAETNSDVKETFQGISSGSRHIERRRVTERNHLRELY